MEDEGAFDDEKIINEVDNEVLITGEEISKVAIKASHEAKLRELLSNITSTEVQLCSDASKEFTRLLRSNFGGELLHQYAHTSCRFSELLEAWKLRQGKPGMSYILSLISAILNHSDGKYRPNDTGRIVISRVLDKFAYVIIEEKLGDVYKELNSKKAKQQNAALLLMASIVRRGSGLASEVAKSFDFKLPIFPKLAEYKQKKFEKKGKHSTRKSFVWFAMSFLEVGKPGLLRWVLQQKEMYSGVLRGLGDDDDDTVYYVLSTLRDRVLTPESLVPTGLRSVLFGSVTLEQLISISGRENGSPATELAHKVLLMVCTDPCNGLMPDLKAQPHPLKGNSKRLLDLMKKLKATEILHHKDLLLAIVNGRPSLGSLYMDEFPYNLEDHASHTWFAAVSLLANLIFSVHTGLSFGFLNSQSPDPPSFDNMDVQSILKCICPCPFTRSVINKGLLHSDFLVKHGTLRLLFDALMLLDSFIGAIDHISFSSNQIVLGWASLKQEIQNKARTLLPDPQVLLTLLSSLNSHSRAHQSSMKRKADLEKLSEFSRNGMKRLKTNIVDEHTDIIVGGISSESGIDLAGDSDRGTVTVVESDNKKDPMDVIAEIWGLHHYTIPGIALKDAEMYLHSKLLDALKIYLRTIPNVLEGSFDFFVNLLGSPLLLQTSLQQSLLSLLLEYIGCSPRKVITMRIPPLMYKYLQPIINLLIFSPVSDIRIQAHGLARAAMLSTGAFDRNVAEIGAWFLFLPGYNEEKSPVKVQGVEVLQNFSSVIISFLCDAISTIGNNLFKYWDLVRSYIYRLKGIKDLSPDFSPLIICVLQKCLRLLSSESGTFTLPDKSMISLYVCNTLKYILQTQVDAALLSAVIDFVLSEGLGDRGCTIDDPRYLFCEWKPLKNLLFFSRSISNQDTSTFFSTDTKSMDADSSFTNTLGEVKRNLRSGHGDGLAAITEAFYSSIICTTSEEILKNFPSVISISQNLLGVPPSLLSSTFFLEQGLFAGVSKLWPEMFFRGLEMVVSEIHHENKEDDTCGLFGRLPSFEGMTSNIDFDPSESASVAFSFFLKLAPFHVLFATILSIDGQYLLEPLKIQDLLVAKLSEQSNDYLISSLRLVLFWIHQIQSAHRNKPLVELDQLSEICYVVVEHILVQLFILKPDSDSSTIGVPLSTQVIKDVVETIFCHPAMIMSLVSPLGSSEELTKGIFGDDMENFFRSSTQGVHIMDHRVLSILIRTSDHLLSLCSNPSSVLSVDGSANKQPVKAFKALTQRLFLELRNRFDLCIGTKDVTPLLPIVCALHALIRFISPFELLELVNWMFSKVDLNGLTVEKSCKLSALSVGFCIAGGAFGMLSSYLEQPLTKRMAYNLFWKVEEKSFNVHLFEKIYSMIYNFATSFKLDSANLCLLKAVDVVFKQKYMQDQTLLPSSLVMLRVIVSTPLEMLAYCIEKTCTTKAKLLFLLSEVSPLHLSVFGHIFSSILNEDLPFKGDVTSNYSLSDNEFMMLLPTALSYLNSVFRKFGKQYSKHFRSIPSFYSRIILSGFINWKSYVSGNVFQLECGEFLPSSTEELLSLVSGSLLGKAIHMLRYSFVLNGDLLKMKKRLKLFDSLFPHSDVLDRLLECEVTELDSYSPCQSLNLINRVVAKISFCRMLLFLEDNCVQPLAKEADGDSKEIPLEVGSNRQGSLRMQFMNILVSSWQLIVKKFPSISVDSEKENSTDNLQFRFLEVFILRSIVESITEMRNDLVQLQSIHFLEQLTKSSLLHRFEDPTTLKMLRSILTLLSEGKFSRVLILQLLVAHSQFAPTICSISKSSNSSQVGAFLRPMSSILRSLVIPAETDGKSNLEMTELYCKQLEVIKLLRVLLHSKAHQYGFDSEKDIDINFRELLSLLLSSYSATLSEVDLELYNLMHEIESIDGLGSGNIAEMDYLWGSAALKTRKEQAHEQDMSSDAMTHVEAVEECQRSQFRENLPIDPKLCLSTVLYFPYDRTACDGSLSLNKRHLDNFMDMLEGHSPYVINTQQYDPVFILRFSIHSLSLGYIEPAEFAGLGLLAVAFVSISLPDVGIRKLGYETLGRFKNALENSRKRKDVARLQLLLTYLQNGIEEPWKRIPSVIAIFTAESSFILLDPSNDHYSTISKLLMRSSRVNLKSIPLFHDFFWTSSVNFKTERLWILRLSYAGLNLDDDAQIYIRNSILEILLSFYVSPLSDTESKELVLQIVRRSVKLHKLARHLVEQCGLISWLSSVVSSFGERLCGDKKCSFLTQLTVVLEVINGVISSRNIVEWLQKYALEQLMELSSHLYKLLVSDMNLIKENVTLVNSVLHILLSTIGISQKRKIYQPHLILSVEGLFQIYEAVNNTRSSPNTEFGLKTILMGTPPVAIVHMKREKLSEFVLWAISTALRLDSTQMLKRKESHELTLHVNEELSEESMISKLLRWLIASVILGKISWKSHGLDTNHKKKSNLETLQSLLEYIQDAHRQENGGGGCEAILATQIFYLQQLLGVNCTVLPSVVSALCLLLLPDASKIAGLNSMLDCGNSVASLLSSIHCPAEANRSWRWSYYQPWNDRSLELTDLEKMDELHACQTLLVNISNVLGNKSLDSSCVVTCRDVEKSGVFKWERNILEH